MGATLRGGAGEVTHLLPATPATCFWGFFDRDLPPVLTVRSGDRVRVETLTHHAGDTPDLLMDDGIRAVWAAIPTTRPGVHVMTGPIAVEGATPGSSLLVRIVDVSPRLPHGSNCAANWGLLYDAFGKEHITIYGLDGRDDGATGARCRGSRTTSPPGRCTTCPASSPSPTSLPASRSLAP